MTISTFLLAVVASSGVALTAVLGALFFGNRQDIMGVGRYVVPVAVGILLSFVLSELIPETLASAPTVGGLVVALGFIGFYVFSNYLHQRMHTSEQENCERKTAAVLFLTSDALHNLADGVVLGSAFLIGPAVGMATAVGLAIHEIPKEIVEFGVLVSAGYTRRQALLRNMMSASAIVIGTVLTMGMAEVFDASLWVITGLAAGALLFLAASKLLPKIHGNVQNYGGVWPAAAAILAGFVMMTVIINIAHSYAPHTHDHDQDAHQDHGEHVDSEGGDKQSEA